MEVSVLTSSVKDQYRDAPKGSFLHQVYRGMQGGNIGLDNGLTGINNYTYGTQQGRYYLIGADSGVGKTTVADFMWVFNAYYSALAMGKRLKIFYYSLEISKTDKIAKWVSLWICHKYGKSLSTDYILHRIKGMPMVEADLILVIEGYREVEKILTCIEFIEDIVHPTRIFQDIIDNHFEKEGVIVRRPSEGKDKKGRIMSYIAKDPNLYTILFIDHLALLATEAGLDIKGTIDRMSRYGVFLRNMFGCTLVYVQQFNTELTSFHRMNKKGDGILTPQRIDFGDSRYTYRDADVVIGLLSPAAYDVEKYLKYNIRELGLYFIAMVLMKNRYGPAHRTLPIFINPLSGIIEDMPLQPLNLVAMEPYYKRVKQLEELCQSYSPKPQSQLAV